MREAMPPHSISDCSFLGLFFDNEVGGNMLLRNVCELPDYTATPPESSGITDICKHGNLHLN
jgi:hypothetical protein